MNDNKYSLGEVLVTLLLVLILGAIGVPLAIGLWKWALL